METQFHDTPPETVVCFDRDWTVSVNPPPDDREAVPLSWVKAYAHGLEGVDVWATGNQRLRGEAAIPGVETARAIRAEIGLDEVPSRPTDPAGAAPVNVGLPTRRDRLRMVADVYDYAGLSPTLVVVDDVDLSDMDGWTHYFSWEFVPAARAGEAAVPAPTDTPFTDTPAGEDPDEPAVDPSVYRAGPSQ